MSQKAFQPSEKRDISENKKKFLLQKYPNTIRLDTTDTSRFICIVCPAETEYYLRWTSFEGHIKSQSHIDREKAAKSTSSFNKNIEKEISYPNVYENSEEFKPEQPLKFNEAGLYLKITKFMLENNRPLLDFLQEITKDFKTEVIRNAHMSQTFKKIVKDCVSQDLKESNFGKLRTTPFSLSLDGSRDVHGSSYVAVTAKLFETELSKAPSSRLISIIPLEDSSIGAVIFEKLHNEVLIDEQTKKTSWVSLRMKGEICVVQNLV